MNKRIKKIFRRLIAVFIAIIIAVGIIISQAPGHILKATALDVIPGEDPLRTVTEDETFDEQEVNIELPALEEPGSENEISLGIGDEGNGDATDSEGPELSAGPENPIGNEPESLIENEPETESEIETEGETRRNVTVTFIVEGNAPVETVFQEGSLIILPEDPEKEGFRFIGWFTDDDLEIGEDAIAAEDLILTARFTQDWIVTFMYGDTIYTSIPVENNSAIGSFPEAPEKEGAQFLGWYSEGHKADESNIVTSDMTLRAVFGYTVTFTAEKDEPEAVLEKVVEEGDSIQSLPSDPFWEGHSFLYWIGENGNKVTEDTVVTSNMAVSGIFESINIYKITVDYFYNDAAGVYHNIDKTVVTVDSRKVTAESPVRISSPPQYEINDDGEVAAGVIYYPATQTIIITAEDLAEADETREIERSVEYSSQAVEYSFVYLLRDLEGDEYSELERISGQAVIGSLVTPEIKNYPFAEQGVTQPYQIERDGQELPVYYERKNFSLIFDSNGGSSVDPVTVPYGTRISISGYSPERTGYSFAGWYLDEALTKPAGSSVTLQNRTTLYAKWTGKEVGYTIVYMKEKYDNAAGGSTYVYDNSRTANAVVGSTVYASSAPKLTNNINGYEADTAKNAQSSVKIAADGSSVLTVYYKLIRYTLTFTHRTSGYSSAYVTVNGTKYTSSKYSISGVVLGQDISALWPSQVSSGINNYSFTGWSYTNESGGSTNRVTKVTELTWELVAKANSSTHTATFNANYKKGVTTKTVEYWLQQPDGKYAKDEVLSQEYASTGTLGAKDINGYTKHNGNASAPSGYSGTSGNTSRFYYDRNTYNIDYYDGGTKLISINNIFFDSNISSSEYNFIPTAPAGEEDHTWGGWYSDASLNTKFSFSKMPANNLALYANWIPPQYTVNFHSNYEGAPDIYDSQTVNRGNPAEEPAVPVRKYYRFMGWFTESVGGRQYLAGSENVEADIDLYAHWEIVPLKYTVRYIDRTTGETLFSEKEVESPAFAPGQQITEEAVVIAGYIPYDSKKSIKLGFESEDNLIVFEYETKSGHMLTYTVEYVLFDDPTVHVAANKQVTVGGTYASVTETAVEATVEKYRNYNPVEVTKTLQLGLNSDTNILTFTYVPRGAMVNISWLDMDGDPIPGMPGRTEFYKVGSLFNVETSIPGYTLHHIEDDAQAGSRDGESYTVYSNSNIKISIYMQKNLTVSAKSKSKVYDGTALTDNGISDVTVSGLAPGHYLESVTVSGSQTLGGTSSAVPQDAVIKGFRNPEYYNITYVAGSLTVVLSKVTINIEPDRWNDGAAYDGSERTIGFRSLRDDPDGTDGVYINNSVYEEKYGRQIRDMVRNITLTEKDAGYYTIPADTIREAISLPEDPGFTVTLNIRDGELTIPQAPITISTPSTSKTYDGTALTKEGAAISGLVSGESAAVIATGSQTDAGVSPNEYHIEWGSAKESNYVIISEDIGTLEVAKRNVTLTSAGAVREYNGQPLTADEVTVGGDGFADGEGADFTVTGSQLTAGSSTNSFEYVLKDGTKAENYNISKSEGLLQVTGREVKYEISVAASSGSFMYDGSEKSIDGFKQNEFEIEGNKYTVSGLEARVSGKDAGTYSNVITGTPAVKDASGNDVTDQFAVNLENGVLEITRRQVTLRSASDSREYNGLPLRNSQVEVSGDGFAAGEGAEYEFSGSQLLAGSSENNFSYVLKEGTKAENYNISVAYGTLTVLNRNAKYEITVTANSGSAVYDGQEKTVSGLKTTQFDIDGRKYFVDGLWAEVSATDAGEYTGNVTGTAVVFDEYGNDVTAQFAVRTESGTLTITRRNIVFTSASDAKEYDGTALSNSSVTVTGDGFAAGEGASFSVTGSRTLVGEADNSFTYVLNEGTKAENYDISTETGTLTIKQRGQKYEITVRAKDNLGNIYDGETKQAEGFETLEFTLNGVPYTVSGLETSDPSASDAGVYENIISGTALVRDAEGNDVTDSFDVKTENGTLEILKRKVTLTSGSARREYNGNALTCGTVEVSGDGFAAGEGAAFEVTGSQLLPGSSSNTFTYTLNEDTKAENYEITESAGTLQVDQRSVKYTISVTAVSGSVTYDGTEAFLTGIETDTFNVDGNTYKVQGLEASGSGTDAGTYDVTITGTATVIDENGNDVSAQFNVERRKGKLTIIKRKVTLSSASESKTYDGNALTFAGREAEAITDGSIVVGDDGFAAGESVNITFTGSQLLPGSSANAFEYVFAEGTKADNYEIAVSFGSLTVNARGENERFSITLKGISREVKYDGAEQSVSGFETGSFVIDGNKYTVDGITSEAAETHAGRYETQITGTAVVRDGAGNDVTDQFDVNTVPGTLTILPRNVALTSASAEKEYDGTALTAQSVTVSGDGLAEGEGCEYTFAGNQTVTGTSENSFSYSLTGASADDYVINVIFGQLRVTDRNVKHEIKVTANGAEYLYDGTVHEAYGLTIGRNVQGEDGSIRFTDNNGIEYMLSGLWAYAAGTAAGEYPVAVSGTPVITDSNGNDVTGQFFIKSENAVLKINKRSVVLTSASESRMYDGNPLENNAVAVSGDGFIQGEGAQYQFSASQTVPGSCVNRFGYSLADGTEAGNYDIQTVFGTLTVTNRDALYRITVKAKDGEFKYNGLAQSVSGLVTGEFVIDGNTYTVGGLSASAEAVHAGTYKVPVTGTAHVYDQEGNDVTGQFAVETEDGELKINRRNVTISSMDAAKVYDGSILTNEEVIFSGDGFAPGEGVDITFTGSRLLPGTADNSFRWSFTGRTTETDYEIKTGFGTLSITDRDNEDLYRISVTAKSAEFKYDGAEHAVSGLLTTSATINGHYYTVEGLEAAASRTDAGITEVLVTGTPKVLDEDGNDVTSQFTVETVSGKLEITKRDIIFTSATVTKEYDGNPLTSSSVEVSGEGFAAGEGAQFNVTGAQMIVGSSSNIFEYTLNAGTKAENYNITKNSGTLTITSRETKYEILVKANSLNETYDGSVKTVSGLEVTEFVIGGNTYKVEGLSAHAEAVNAGTYPVEITGIPKVTDSEGNDITDQFAVIQQRGTLNIAKAPFELQAASEQKKYDGIPLVGTVSGDIPEGSVISYSTDGGNTWTDTAPEQTMAGSLEYLVRIESDNYETSIAECVLNVSRRTVVMTSADASKQYDGNALTNNRVSVSGDGFAEGDGAEFLVSGSQLLVGTSKNDFTYTLNAGTDAANYEIQTEFGTLNVLNRDALYQITVKAISREVQYNGTEQSIEGLVQTEFDIDGNTYRVSGLSAGAQGLHAGRYKSAVTGTAVVMDAAGNDVTDQFAVETEDGELNITRRSVIITSVDSAKTYDGSALKMEEVAYSGDGFVPGEGVEIIYSGAILLPGTAQNSFSWICSDGTRADDYDITEVFGTLKVTDRDSKDLFEITVRADSAEFKYDGLAHEVNSISNLTSWINGHKYTVEGLSALASQTDAGSYDVEVSGNAKVVDEDGNDVTAQFSVLKENGRLVINRREVTLTSATVSKEYDGKPLSSSTVEITGDGFVDGEGAVYTVTGTQTIVGSSTNAFTYSLNSGTKAENYNITKNEGLLSITSREAKYEITVRANSLEEKYDGEVKTVSGFDSEEFEVDGSLYTVEGITAQGSAADAGSYPVAISGIPKVLDENGNDVTGQFVVNLESGRLNITRRDIVLVSASATKEYDGNALTSETVEVEGDGFAEGEGAGYEFTGSQLTAGFSSNTFTYKLSDGTKESNYNITLRPGTLTVTNRKSRYEIEIEALSGEFVYDGTEKTVEGLESVWFGIGSNTYKVEGLSASQKAVHAGTYSVAVAGTPVVRDKSGNDVTDQFKVTSTPGTLKILPRNVVLTSGSATGVYNGKALRNTDVHVGGDGFAAGDGVSIEVTGSRTITGFSDNTFSYSLNEGTEERDYVISTVFGSLTIISRAEDARFEVVVKAESGKALYDGSTHEVSGYSINGSHPDEDGNTEFEIDGVRYVISGISATAEAVNAGTYPVNVTGNVKVSDSNGNNVTDQFIVIPESGTLNIGKRQVILTSGSVTHAYTGRSLTNGKVVVSGDGFAEGEGAVFDVTGGRTIPGISENTFTYTLNDNTKAENYDITVVSGTITVENRDAKYVVRVQALSGEYLYDGTEKAIEGFEDTDFNLNGHKFVIRGLSAKASAVDAGEYVVKAGGTPSVYDEEGNDVSEQFAVEASDGTMTILPRTVVLTSQDATKEYDGLPLSNPEVKVSGDGFVDGEGVIISAESSRTLKGTSQNVFTWILDENTKASNYIISEVFGALNVVDREALYEIVINANSLEVLFDAEEHEISGFETMEFEIEGNIYRVEGIESLARGTDAGIYSCEYTGTARVLDAEGNDVTDQFAVSVVSGNLNIKANYLLTINYVDEDGKLLAASFSNRYQPGESFGPFVVPAVEGFTADHDVIYAPENGMPERDIVINVIYHKEAAPAPVVPEQETTEPETEPEGGETQPEGDETQPEGGETQPESSETQPGGEIQPEPGVPQDITPDEDPRKGQIVVDDNTGETEIVDIEDMELPLAPARQGYWALVNLLLVLATVFTLCLMAVEYFLTRRKKDKEDMQESEAYEENEEKEEESSGKRISLKIVLLGLIPAIGSIIAFLLTEDITNSVRMVDIWTILMVVIFALELLLLIFGRRRKEQEEQEEEQEE